MARRTSLRACSGHSPIRLRLTAVPGAQSLVVRRADEVFDDGRALTRVQAVALAALQEHFGAKGATPGDWHKVLRGIPERSRFRAIKVLEERGHVHRVGPKFVPAELPKGGWQ